jgi:hypothetical protein
MAWIRLLFDQKLISELTQSAESQLSMELSDESEVERRRIAGGGVLV